MSLKQIMLKAEARALHEIGFAIHWLMPQSKRPVEMGWTTGPRKEWPELNQSHKEAYNVGVRLGQPSKIGEKYLAVIDVDVKSVDTVHLAECEKKLKELIGEARPPEVASGRGNGSRHLYYLSNKPETPRKLFQSPTIVKVSMPSARPSKKELAALRTIEIEKGIRLRPAWEICIMGEGQQVVLPPSIHPDSGKEYKWINRFDVESASAIRLPEFKETKTTQRQIPLDGKSKIKLDDFEVSPVDLGWLPISEKIRAMILTGEGVEDRSAMLLPVSHALYSAGLSRNEILTVLTDKDTFIGSCAFEHAQTTKRDRAAYWAWKYTVKKVFDEHDAEKMFRDPVDTGHELTPHELEENMESFDEMKHWTEELDITEKGVYRSTIRNVVTILTHGLGEKLEDEILVKRDLFAFRDFYFINAPWGGKKGESITDDDIPKIKLWFGKHWGFEPSDNVIGGALTVLATENAFDPALDWLNSLAPWDGVERLDTWLVDHFGAEGDPDYLAQVFRKWIVAMVMRIKVPGAKFDWMPIFEGAQGVGKSSFGRLLVGDKYFLDWLPDLNNKDSALALQGVWSVEMGELASFRKNEIESVKAFITRTVDKVRPPYGQRWLESPRRCVFFGTTNFETYLRDDSGNRRFKPVKVGRLDFEALREEREQLFAEAIYLFDYGFETERTLDISGKAKIYEQLIQGEKMVADESMLMAEALQIFIENNEKKAPEYRFNFDKFRMQDLFKKSGDFGQGIGPLENWKFDSRGAQFASKALKSLKMEKFKSNGVVYWKWPK